MPDIILTNGMPCKVDDDKFEELNQWQWHSDLDKTTGRFYATRKFYVGHWRDGKRSKVRMHRLIIGAEKGQLVDHINLDTLDNRLCNLRIVTTRKIERILLDALLELANIKEFIGQNSMKNSLRK